MKKFLLLPVIAILLVGCSDDNEHRMNGYWQLRSITDSNGITMNVDTVFYAFQKEILFSLTVLKGTDNSCISYGYIDFPSSDQVHIAMDTTGLNTGSMINVCNDFLESSTWETYQDTFSIYLNGKNLQLSNKNKKYILKKF